MVFVMARKVQTQIRKEQIAEAALDVVHAHGLRGLRMERVAQRVGIVPSALYRHFPGKQAVIDAMLDLIREKLEGVVASVSEEPVPPLERLRLLLRKHLALVQHFQAIPRLLFSDEVCVGHPERKARIYETITRYLDAVAGVIREAQAEGTVRDDVDTDTVAVMFLGLFQPAAILMFMSDGGFDAARHLDRAWVAFYEGIAPASDYVIGNSQKRMRVGAKRR
jgi:AcrR family transcriptional regulator